MNARRELEEASRLRRLIETLQEEIDARETYLTAVKAINYDKVNVQTTPSNVMEDQVIALMESKEKLARLLGEYVARYETISSWVAAVPDRRQRDVLSMRYLEGWTLREISDFFGWTSGRRVFQVLKAGVQSVQKMIGSQ